MERKPPKAEKKTVSQLDVTWEARSDKPKIRLLLDSGAFSAWSGGAPIDIDNYCAFIKENLHLIDTYVVLDMIPGRPGGARTQAMVEESASESYKNLQYMKKQGLKPLPVFHMGERWYWLEKMVADGENYIGLSAKKGMFPSEHERNLDQAFTIITKGDGTPIIDTHGFGITSHRLLIRYPWTTVDSTTWSMSAGYGKVFIPHCTNAGEWDYYHSPHIVIISGVRQASTGGGPMEFGSFGPIARDRVKRYLAEIGLTIPDCRNDDEARRKAILHYFQEFEKHVQVPKFLHRARGGGFWSAQED